MFVKREFGKITVIIVYVDDTLVTGNNEEKIVNLKAKLDSEFEIKDLSPLKLSWYRGCKTI